jgi:hypothetical protein
MYKRKSSRRTRKSRKSKSRTKRTYVTLSRGGIRL